MKDESELLDEQDIIANIAAPAYGGPYDVDGKPLFPQAQVDFDVVLAETTHRMNTIKVVREIRGCSLWDARKIVDGTPALIAEDVTQTEAEEIAEKLRNAGGIVKIR
jgi:ribosomal protein L7/L12